MPPHRRSRTPGISCEAVPASIRDGAGMRRHLRLSAACGARVGAAESFVSFIPLFGGAPGALLEAVNVEEALDPWEYRSSSYPDDDRVNRHSPFRYVSANARGD